MKYLALSIGPIYETFSQAKRTRTIWAASYFFSLFIREIFEKTIEKNWDILLPYDKKIVQPDTKGINKGNYGAGLYADRLYFKDKTVDDIYDIVDSVINAFASDIHKTTKYKNIDIIKTFLKNYINIHYVQIDISEEELDEIKKSTNNSVLKILNNLLDQKELMQKHVFNFEENILINYLSAKWNKDTKLKTDAFGQNSSYHFKSIGEIAIADLFPQHREGINKILEKEFKNDDIELIPELSKITKKSSEGKYVSIIKDYHKYYAVLYADGDNIGDLLNKIAHDDNKLKTFSKKLFEFGLEAEKSFHNFGASAIYLGGEDILAFLPIAYWDGKTLQSLAVLIENLDKNFFETVGAYAKELNEKIPTLSYGIMLSYYKFPVREAMEHAHQLLKICKNNEVLFPYKNGISVRFQKHSGQFMQCFIDKSKTKSTQLLLNLLTKNLSALDNKDTLSSLIQRLKDNIFFTTFIQALRHNNIKAIMENFFNEEIHASKSTFIDYFIELALALKDDYLTNSNIERTLQDENQRIKDILFTVLRYYQFIKN